MKSLLLVAALASTAAAAPVSTDAIAPDQADFVVRVCHAWHEGQNFLARRLVCTTYQPGLPPKTEDAPFQRTRRA